MKKIVLLLVTLLLFSSCGLFDEIKEAEEEFSKEQELFFLLEKKTTYKPFNNLNNPLILLSNKDVYNNNTELDGTAFIIWDWENQEVFDWCFTTNVKQESLVPLFKVNMEAFGGVGYCLAPDGYSWITLMNPNATALEFKPKTKPGFFSIPTFCPIVPTKLLLNERQYMEEYFDTVLFNVYDINLDTTGKTFLSEPKVTGNNRYSVDFKSPFWPDTNGKFWYLTQGEDEVILCKVDIATQTTQQTAVIIPELQEIDIGLEEPFEQYFNTNIVYSSGKYIYIDSHSSWQNLIDYDENYWLENYLYQVNTETLEVKKITYNIGENGFSKEDWGYVFNNKNEFRLFEYDGKLFGIFIVSKNYSFVQIDFETGVMEPYQLNGNSVFVPKKIDPDWFWEAYLYDDTGYDSILYQRGSRIYFVSKVNISDVDEDGVSIYKEIIRISYFDIATGTLKMNVDTFSLNDLAKDFSNSL